MSLWHCLSRGVLTITCSCLLSLLPYICYPLYHIISHMSVLFSASPQFQHYVQCLVIKVWSIFLPYIHTAKILNSYKIVTLCYTSTAHSFFCVCVFFKFGVGVTFLLQRDSAGRIPGILGIHGECWGGGSLDQWKGSYGCPRRFWRHFGCYSGEELEEWINFLLFNLNLFLSSQHFYL